MKAPLPTGGRLRCSAASPRFVTVTTAGSLVSPTGRAPKSSRVGLSSTSGAPAGGASGSRTLPVTSYAEQAISSQSMEASTR